jgi:hypothetical protein
MFGRASLDGCTKSESGLRVEPHIVIFMARDSASFLVATGKPATVRFLYLRLRDSSHTMPCYNEVHRAQSEVRKGALLTPGLKKGTPHRFWGL